MLDVVTPECAKHALEYCHEQAGTTWVTNGKGHRKFCLWIVGTGMPLEIFLLGKNTMTSPTVPHKRRPLTYMHTAHVLPYQPPPLYETSIPQL